MLVPVRSLLQIKNVVIGSQEYSDENTSKVYEILNALPADRSQDVVISTDSPEVLELAVD